MLFYTLIFLQTFFTVQAQSIVNCKTPDNQNGTCISAKTCRVMLEFLHTLPKPAPPEILAKLKLYKCGRTTENPKICCPEKPISFNKPVQTQEHFNLPDVSKHRNLGLLPRKCGRVITLVQLVTNKTALDEFPWMALLSYDSTTGLGFRCGASILNEKYVLTAAHCVTGLENTAEKLKLIGVRVGEHDIRTVEDCEYYEDEEGFCNPPVQDLRIEEVIPHRNYDTRTRVNDIALLRVSKIDLTQENAKPVCMPFGDTGNFNYTGRNLIVTGWGLTEAAKPSPDGLLKAELPVVPVTECAEYYKKYRKVTEKQLCAEGENNVERCLAESGGPLHSLELLFDEPRYVQQGILSFRPADCRKAPLPGVYTRVAFYMDWILDNIRP